MIRDIIFGIQGHGEGVWDTNNVSHRGAPVFINKQDLIFPASDKISSHSWQ